MSHECQGGYWDKVAKANKQQNKHPVTKLRTSLTNDTAKPSLPNHFPKASCPDNITMAIRLQKKNYFIQHFTHYIKIEYYRVPADADSYK